LTVAVELTGPKAWCRFAIPQNAGKQASNPHLKNKPRTEEFCVEVLGC